MMGAIIVDRTKNRFINIIGSKKCTYTRDVRKAKVYDEWTARNIVASNLPKAIRFTSEVLMVEQDAYTEAITKVYDPKGIVCLKGSVGQNGHNVPSKGNNEAAAATVRKSPVKQLHGYNGEACDELMRRTLNQFSEILSEVDLELSDAYHFIVEHPRMPANKAIQIFYALRAVLLRRAEVKRYIAALETGLAPEKYPYRPRTELYDKLKEMTGLEDVQADAS